MGRVLAAALAVLITFPVTTGANAAPPTASEVEGRRRFKRGQELNDQNKFVEAAHEFEAGFNATGRPDFLYNVGQAYRRANDWAKAKAAYERFLRLDPETPLRATVLEHIKGIDDLDISGANSTGVATPPTAPVAPPRNNAALVPTPAPPERTHALTASSTPASEHEKEGESPPIYKRTWFWIVVGGVVAAGATGLVLSLRKDCKYDLCVSEKASP